ncbi:uncharacterized protein LOC134185034 [Corticium candelabrum]|uniref:uncharacterized protein LOC134185034 n=1 Tax=Corticium candelabrum TaxID=121492 RepID=UPI002E371FD1|nr:uncharacterized protein LOC134185034 [Corticium candelabrum]
MKAMVISGGVVIGGWALIKYITPPREKLLESLLPEERELIKQAEEDRTQDMVVKIIKESALSNEPIWKIGKLDRKTLNSDK